MRKTVWSQTRLVRLFQRYNRRFWTNKLRDYRVSIAKLNGPWGKCDERRKMILFDIEAHPSDYEVRSTLLHEMAHAAAGLGRLTHGSGFWKEIERLLRKGAPIGLGSPEAGGLKVLHNVVPAKFPLARKVLNRIQKAEEQKICKLETRGELDGEFVINKDYILDRFVEAARNPRVQTQEDATLVVGAELGLIDVDGKPTNPWIAHVFAIGRKAFRHERAFFESRLRSSHTGPE